MHIVRGNHRPAFVAIHSGGYAANNENGDKDEMQIACEHFAARGYVAITMNYRLTNAATGGGLAPANWSGIHRCCDHTIFCTYLYFSWSSSLIFSSPFLAGDKVYSFLHSTYSFVDTRNVRFSYIIYHSCVYPDL